MELNKDKKNIKLASAVPSAFIISVWNTLCSRAEWVSFIQIIYLLPPLPLFYPLIHSNSQCVNQVQSLNSPHRQEKLYTCSSSESGERPRDDPSCSPHKDDTLSPRYCINGNRKRDELQEPLLTLGLLFGGWGGRRHVVHVLNFRVQEEYKRF